MFTGEKVLSKKLFVGIVLIFTLAVSFIFWGCNDSTTNAKKTINKEVKPNPKLQNPRLLLEAPPGSPAPSMQTVMKAINFYLGRREMENALDFTNKLIEKFPDFKKEKYFMRFRKKMINNLSLKDRLGKFVFDKKTGLGEFVMQINCYMNKYTLVRFYVPVDASGKALPEANDILMYIPWTGEANKTFFKGINKSYLDFARREKMTIFTFTNWCHRFSYTGDTYFPVKEAGWYPYVFKMQKYIEQKFKLKSRKLFISGQSSGGSMSQRLSAACPDKIAAAAWNWGTSYTNNIPKKMPPMLIMNNWSAYISHNDNASWLANESKGNGNYVLRGYGPPRPTSRAFDYHGASDATLDLLEQFIADLRNLRIKNNGKIPAYKSWYKVTDKAGQNKYYPSKEFYNKWKQLPLDAIKNMKSRHPDKLLIFPKLVKNPDRVVLYVGSANMGRNIFNRFCLWDAMYYLAKNGAIAVSVNPTLVPAFPRGVLDKILANKEWEKLNVYIVAVGSAGNTFISKLENYNNPRLKGIKLFAPASGSTPVKTYKDVTVYIPGSSNEKGKNGLKYYNPKISPRKVLELIAEK